MANTSLEKYVEQSAASVAPLKQKSIELLERAKQITVTDDFTLQQAVDMKKVISKQSTSVATARKQMTAPLDNVKSQLMDLERDVMVELDEAKTYIGKQILDYEAEQERKRVAEETRIQNLLAPIEGSVEGVDAKGLDAMAAALKNHYGSMNKTDQSNPRIKSAVMDMVSRIKKRRFDIEEDARRAAEQAELDKVRAEQSAEAARIAEERAANAAEERRIAREREELESRKRQQALEDERRAKEGADRKAAAAAPKTNSVTMWSFEIEDLSRVPREYLMLDESKINKAVKAAKGNIEIPGIKVISERKSR